MKKIINILLLATVVGFVSCDLDKESPDSIPFEEAFVNIGSVEGLERGAYSRLRTAYDLNSMIVPDLQADYAHAVYGFTNTYGPVYKWEFTQEADEAKQVWQLFYGSIGLDNFIIDGIDKHLKFEPTTEERTALNRIQGNAYLMRALSYSILAERFCGDYDAATAKKDYSGVPLMTGYDTSIKPARASLYDVYDRILKDIEQAKTLLKTQLGAANSTTLTIDCVTALEARVLLQMDNYPEALKKANDLLIGNTTYSLVDSPEALQEMWTYDKSPETIFQFYASQTEVAYQWGIYFYQDNYNGTSATQNLMTPDYIPTQTCVDQFVETDWRRTAYFQDCSSKMQIDGRFILPYIKGHGALAEKLVLFKKYPGNPDLRTTSSWNYYNTYKPFRLAEIYLIAAEAAAQSGGDAATPLNELRKHRGLAELSTVTLADVQAERYREMMLEGTRLTDLKRWGLGMTRGEAQTGDLSETGGNPWFTGSYVTEGGANIQKAKGDYMFVWPIPASEIFANQQLSGQQNPGWIR